MKSLRRLILPTQTHSLTASFHSCSHVHILTSPEMCVPKWSGHDQLWPWEDKKLCLLRLHIFSVPLDWWWQTSFLLHSLGVTVVTRWPFASESQVLQTAQILGRVAAYCLPALVWNTFLKYILLHGYRLFSHGVDTKRNGLCDVL